MWQLTKQIKQAINKENPAYGDRILNPGVTFVGFLFNNLDINAKTAHIGVKLYDQNGTIIDYPATGTVELNNKRLTINGINHDINLMKFEPGTDSVTGQPLEYQEFDAFTEFIDELIPDVTEKGRQIISMINMFGKTVGDYI